MTKSLSLVVLITLLAGFSAAQERSPVLKDQTAERSPFYLKIDRSTEDMFNAFLLVKKANSGDPVAQHELGLRYLTGQAFAPDTPKAALWIGRASEQKYVPAIYNFGILQNNGWGTPWDPFSAFLNFGTAAEKGLIEGKYMYGLLLTDNLVVARDYAGAYRWIKEAADSGFASAREVLEDFEKTGLMARIRSAQEKSDLHDSVNGAGATDPAKSTQQTGSPHVVSPRQSGSPTTQSPPPARQSQSALQPVFLDMETDTLADPDDATLIEEALYRDDPRAVVDTIRPDRGTVSFDSVNIVNLIAGAEGGSPEALTLMGRQAQMGWGIPVDRVGASFYYIRAIRCDSRWAPVLLWRLVHTPGYFELLKNEIVRKDGSPGKAGYIWASLVATGFDGQLTGEQVVGYLRSASEAGMTDALVELALCHYAGYGLKIDAAKGDSLLARAAELGSREAEVRLVMSRLRDNPGKEPEPGGIAMLDRWDAEGSVLAQVILGYCYEEGTGVGASIPTAVSYYRQAARRGSRIAYDALRRLYDNHRPDDALFYIPEEGN